MLEENIFTNKKIILVESRIKVVKFVIIIIWIYLLKFSLDGLVEKRILNWSRLDPVDYTRQLCLKYIISYLINVN